MAFTFEEQTISRAARLVPRICADTCSLRYITERSSHTLSDCMVLFAGDCYPPPAVVGFCVSRISPQTAADRAGSGYQSGPRLDKRCQLGFSARDGGGHRLLQDGWRAPGQEAFIKGNCQRDLFLGGMGNGELVSSRSPTGGLW